jgi:hypothetical protein
MWRIIGHAIVGLEAGILFVLLFEPGGTHFHRVGGKAFRSYSEGSNAWQLALMLFVPTLGGAWIGLNRRAKQPNNSSD